MIWLVPFAFVFWAAAWYLNERLVRIRPNNALSARAIDIAMIPLGLAMSFPNASYRTLSVRYNQPADTGEAARAAVDCGDLSASVWSAYRDHRLRRARLHAGRTNLNPRASGPAGAHEARQHAGSPRQRE